MQEIPLTQGQVALVDDRDYGYLMGWKWMVRLQLNGIDKYLGLYKDLDKAIAARKAAEEKYIGEFAFNN